MMPSPGLLNVADAVIELIVNKRLTDDLIRKLLSVFPENILLGALDLIDREKSTVDFSLDREAQRLTFSNLLVIKHTIPWSYPHYQVLGSTDTYHVFLDMTISPVPFYCTCPAFAYVVLSAGSELMCKHVLAVQLANKLSLFIEHPMKPDDLQATMVEQYKNDTVL